jgi:hypothetical protein
MMPELMDSDGTKATLHLLPPEEEKSRSVAGKHTYRHRSFPDPNPNPTV